MSAQSDEGEGAVSADDLEMDSKSDDGFVDGAGQQMLEEYRESKWGVVDDIDDESTVEDLEEIVGEKRIERRLTYQDEEMFQELSPPKADQMDVLSQYADVHAEDRNQFVPDAYEEATIDFPIPESERVDTCTNCNGNGNIQCSSCNGGGRQQCGRCNGSGVRNESTCSKCGGTGSRVCGNCDGNGRVVCGQCEQRGQTYKMDFIRREYTPETNVEVDAPGVPDSYVHDAEGEYVKTNDVELADNEIRHEIEEREVPVAKLDYEYDGKEYSLYHVEDELKSESYPMSRTRRLLPVAAVSIVLVIAGLWYFGVI